ncbi:kinase binding protein CGI-121-domain-containing protein [Schizothecium vesticola]|uniref:EKC/KEOPS complex subunit CGI121 n=1 Tax=Schizothecium vesticola TaxID=314040 RepID=A0AA40EU41_9PEZI|nr:kinase binding protein CGI-121-domain-containing protein [Schizothecium vesticola]
MSLETLTIDHLPPNYCVYAALFRDVSNPDFLHAQLLARNNAYDFAFIDASSVISRLHLLSAIFRGLTTLADGTLTATTPHAEIVLSFGVNNNVSDAYRRYGISPKTKDVIVVKVVVTEEGKEQESQSAEEIWAHLAENVKGTPTELTDAEIAKSTDWQKMRKYYGLNNVPGIQKGWSEERRDKELEALVVMKMALRGL